MDRAGLFVFLDTLRVDVSLLEVNFITAPDTSVLVIP